MNEFDHAILALPSSNEKGLKIQAWTGVRTLTSAMSVQLLHHLSYQANKIIYVRSWSAPDYVQNSHATSIENIDLFLLCIPFFFYSGLILVWV